METHVDCEFLTTCPIFRQFKTKGVANIWVSLYCRGSKQPECARKMLRIKGQDAPLTLLPSGQHLMASPNGPQI
jgi:hypothetical protein